MESTQRGLSPARVWAARILAIAADFFQIVVFPAFAPGAASVVNDALDVVVALSMILLIGWHWAFLPTFAAELVPLFDLVPTWTAAVFFATRRSGTPKATRPPEVNRAVIDAQVVSSSPAREPESDRRSMV